MAGKTLQPRGTFPDSDILPDTGTGNALLPDTGNARPLNKNNNTIITMFIAGPGLTL